MSNERLRTTRDNRIHAKVKEFANALADAIDVHRSEILAEAIEQASIPDKTSDKKSACLQVSDNHFGAAYKKDAGPKGVAKFDMEVAAAMLDHCVSQSITAMKEDGLHKYDEFVLFLSGDHVEGDGTIYPHQSSEVTDAIFGQTTFFHIAIIKNIYLLSDIMKQVDGILRISGVPGNHGKNKSNKTNHPVKVNYDTMIFKYLDIYIKDVQKRYNDLLNVVIEFPEDEWSFRTQVKGWSIYHAHHMPQIVQKGDGRNKIASYVNRYGIDLFLTGHFHTSTLFGVEGAIIMRSASFPGDNHYSEELAEFGRSAQNYFVTTKSELIHSYKIIDLEKFKWQ